MDNQGHGHVKPRKDGQIMRCGGPGFCAACSVEASHELTRLRAELAESQRQRDEANKERDRVLDENYALRIAIGVDASRLAEAQKHAKVLYEASIQIDVEIERWQDEHADEFQKAYDYVKGLKP